jgi:hypothetical protein
MSKITKSAKAQPCQIRLEGCQSGGENETTVFAHINGAGMGQKSLDIHGFYSCFTCHEVYDRRKNMDYEIEWLDYQGLLAMKRTQELLVKQGLIRHD